jgi:hypothetical protein
MANVVMAVAADVAVEAEAVTTAQDVRSVQTIPTFMLQMLLWFTLLSATTNAESAQIRAVISIDNK